MTNHEKEKQPTKKEKKEKKPRTLLGLIAKIEQLAKKIEVVLDNAAKEQLSREKRSYELQRDRWIRDFHENTEHGRETLRAKQDINSGLEKVIVELEGIPDKDFPEKNKETQKTIEEKRQQAEELWQKEPEDLNGRYKGCSKHELDEIIREKEARQREIEEKRKEKSKGKEKKEERRVAPGAMSEDNYTNGVIKGLEEKLGRELTDEEREKVARDAERDPKELRKTGYYGFTEAGKELIKTDPEFRERTFESFFYGPNAMPQEEFWQTIDTDTRTEISQFFQVLSEPELGKEGQLLVNRYQSEFTMRRVFHDAAWGVEYGAIKPYELPNHVRVYSSNLHEFLFKKEWVAEAARLYEKAFEKLLDEDGFVNFYKVCLRPKKIEAKGEITRAGEVVGISEVDEWVYTQLEKSLKKRGVSEKERETWKMRRAMALGKQHGIFSMRLVELAARGRLPTEKGVAERSMSPWAEDYVRVFDVIEHYLEKFGIGDDALAMFYFYSTGRLPVFESHEDVIREFEKLRAEKNERFAETINLLGAGGPDTLSFWRAILAASQMKDEDLRYLGTNLRLNIETDRLKKEIKNGDFDKGGLLLKETLEDPEWGTFLTEEGNENLKKRLEVFKRKFSAFKQRLKAGEASKAEIEGMGAITKKIQEVRRRIIWKEGLETNPLQVLREAEIVDEVNENFFSERNVLEEEQRKRILSEIYDDLSLLSEIAVSKEERNLSFDHIEDKRRREQTEFYFNKIRDIAVANKMEVIRGLAKKELEKFPLGLSTSDVSWERLEFALTGKAAHDRRIRDMAGAATVQQNLIELLNTFPALKSEEAIAKAVYEKICVPVRGYDSEKAGELGEFFTEMIARWNLSDTSVRWAPWPIGWILDMTRRNSAAERRWGEEAVAWNKQQERSFISLMAGLGALGTDSNKKAEELFKKLHATNAYKWGEFLCRWTPLGLIMIGGLLIKEAWEELQKGLEEAV